MSKYTVYRQYISGRDGDKGFDNLVDAKRDFNDACKDDNVMCVELIDNIGNEPKILFDKLKMVR